MRAAWVVVLALSAAGCGSSDGKDGGSPGGGANFGQSVLSSLDEPCEGVAGLTGQAILDQRADSFSATLSYVTASGGKIDPTALDVQITWPSAPVATCYPAYPATGQTLAAPRVSIEGLSMTFETADGKFDESLAAKAWLPVLNGAPQFAQVLAVTSRGKLVGSWQPFPEYAITASTTMGFVTRLAGASTAAAGGNVSATATSAAELDAGVFKGGFALAIWP